MRRGLALLALGGFALCGAAHAQRVEGPGSLPGPTLGTSPDSGVPPSVPTMPVMPDLIVDLSEPRVSITSAF